MPEDLLTFVCREWSPYVVVKDNRLEGSRGRDEYKFWGSKLDGINLTYVTPSDEMAYGRDTGNGSYTGVLGMLQRKEADAHCLATGMVFSPDVVDHILVAKVYEGIIFQCPSVNTKNLSILQTLNVFSPTLWSLFVIASIMLAIVFTLKGRKRSIYLHSFNIFRSHLGQTEIMPTWKPISCIFGLLMVASSFVILTENLIHTDLVTIDFSNVTNNIEDVDRLSQYTPCVLKGTAITEIIYTSQKEAYKRIRKRIEEAGTEFEPSDLIFKWKPNHVWLASKSILIGFSQIMCGLNETYKFWIPEAPFAELPVSYFLRKGLEPRKRRLVESRSRRICEHGLDSALDRKVGSLHAVGSASDSCKREKMNDLFDQQEEGIASCLTSLGLVYGFFIALILSLNVFIVETVVKLILF